MLFGWCYVVLEWEGGGCGGVGCIYVIGFGDWEFVVGFFGDWVDERYMFFVMCGYEVFVDEVL